MIHLSLPLLVLVYLLALLGSVLGAWLVAEWRRVRRELRAFKHVQHCALCGFDFEDSSEAALPRCPRCASLNERSRHSLI